MNENIMKRFFLIFFVFSFSCALPYNYDFVKNDFNGVEQEPVPVDDETSTCDSESHEVLNEEGECVCADDYERDSQGACVLTESTFEYACQSLSNQVWNPDLEKCVCEPGYWMDGSNCIVHVGETGEILPDPNEDCIEGYQNVNDICSIIGEPLNCGENFFQTPSGCICPAPNFYPSGELCLELEQPETWFPTINTTPIYPNFLEQKIYIQAQTKILCKSFILSSIDSSFFVNCYLPGGTIHKSSTYYVNDGQILSATFDYSDAEFKLGILFKKNDFTYPYFAFYTVNANSSFQPVQLPTNGNYLYINHEPSNDYKVKRIMESDFISINQASYYVEIKKPSGLFSYYKATVFSQPVQLIIMPSLTDYGLELFQNIYYFFYKGTDGDYLLKKFINEQQITENLSGYSTDIIAFDGIYRNGDFRPVYRYLAQEEELYYIKEYTVGATPLEASILKVDGEGVSAYKNFRFSSFVYFAELNENTLKVAVFIGTDNIPKLFYYDGVSTLVTDSTGIPINVILPPINPLKLEALDLKIIDENKFVIFYPDPVNNMVEVTFTR